MGAYGAAMEEVEAMGNRRAVQFAGFTAAILLILFGLIGGGFSGALLMLGLSALFVGVTAAIIGRARWAFIPSRRVGGLVAIAEVVAVSVGGATLPPPTLAANSSAASASSSVKSSPRNASPTREALFTASEAPSTASGAPSTASEAPSTDNEGAIQATEEALAEAESNERTNTGASDIPGELSDEATTAAVDGAPASSALAALAAVEVKGRAPKTGYTRDQFGTGWRGTDRKRGRTRASTLRSALTG